MSDQQPWAGIIRVSHLGGRSGDTFHADREQHTALEREAQHRGIVLEVLPAELDISGGLPLEKRPSLLQAVEGVERGEYAGIMVAYLSRLGRNVREQLRVWDRVEAVGGRIIVVQEGIDTSTPAGRFQRTVMLGVAEMELDLHRERFENLREWATHAGVWQRRQTPLGYSRDAATRRLVPDQDADQVREAFAARLRGDSVSAIAAQLKMTASGARALLKNRVYLGELKVGKHVNPAAHEAIIDPGVFLAVQTMKGARPPRSNLEIALLAGLIRCAGCGHVMSRGKTGGHTSYGCSRYKSAGKCTAPAAVKCAAIDEHVTALALREFSKLRITADVKGDRDIAAQRVRDAEQELARFLSGVNAAGIEESDFAAAAHERRTVLDKARSDLAATVSAGANDLTVDPVTLWDGLSMRHRNQLLRGLLEVVIVRAVGRGRQVAVNDRSRVIVNGAGIVSHYQGGGVARPVVELPFPDLTDPVVLGP